MVAKGFWDCQQKAYFDVRVFNPLAPTYSSISLPLCYRQAEIEKSQMYEEHIREVEHGSFTPLVFLCSGALDLWQTLCTSALQI